MCDYVVILTFMCCFIQVGFSESVQGSESAKLRVHVEKDDGRSSLIFVFDTTGSMYNDLRQLREGAEMIMNTALEESNIIADFVFVPFHDPGVGPATVTSDREEFKAALNRVVVYGGGDCPEKSLSGVQMALAAGRPRSLLYVFTDATAGDHRLAPRVLDAVMRKQSQVVFVLTGHCNDLQKPSYLVYRQIAAASSGQVFHLNKTNVHQVLDFVRSSIRGRNVNLGSSVNPPGYNHTQAIPVDSNLAEVTVSVSGLKPQIKVVDPKGEELTGPPRLVTTLDLSEIMVVKVSQPEPGNWSVTVGSAREHSVRVQGLSNLTFLHGFSVQPPRGMRDTSYMPLKSTYNHLMISLTEADAPVKIEYAEVLDLSGKTLFELPLKEMDEHKGVYLADPFLPPDELFYVAINGRDENGQELRRVGATAVQAKLPDVSYLTAPQKVSARLGSRVALSCVVESLVPVTARWTRGADRIQPQTSSLQSTSIDYVIEEMSEDHVGTYTCFARNIAGLKTVGTEVVLIADPPQVILSPGNKTLLLGDELVISCQVSSEAPLRGMRLVYKGMDRDVSGIFLKPNEDGLYIYNDTIAHVDEGHAGLYTCIAESAGGESKQTINITVQTQPIVQILGPHSVTKPIHSDLQIFCHVENADTMQWVAPNDSVVMEKTVNGSYDCAFEVRNVTGGRWTCVGLRGPYKATDAIDVDVLIKPVVAIEGSKNITAFNGTAVDVTCLVTARPAPRIIWHRETETFLNHVVTPLGDNVYRSVLQLATSEAGGGATYFCIGENSEGIAEDSAVLTVRRPLTLLQGFTDKTVEIYSQVDLHCQVDAYPPAIITWSHNGTSLTPDGNVQVSEDGAVVYLPMVDFDNLGLYSCTADNGYEAVTVNGTLSVRGLEVPVLEKEPAKYTVKKGESSVLTCRVVQGKPDPILSWQYRGKAEEFSDLPWGVALTDDGTNLTVSDVTIGHDGVYRCIAENVIGRDEYDVELLVQYPPEFIETGDDSAPDHPIEMEAGRRVSLSCPAVGVPPPVVVWARARRPLAYTDNVHLTDSNDLVIENVTEYDSGLYSCSAESSLGSSRKNFTLVVYVRARVRPSPEPHAEYLEGQLVQLPCAADGAPPPSVSWLRDGEKINDARKYIDDYGIRFIANVTDFGNYTCFVENDYGNDSITYPVYVWVPPSIRPVETPVDILVGMNATLRCNAVGFPIPEIVWEFEEEELTANSTDVSFDDIGNLFITNASVQVEGSYACVASNGVGVDRRFIDLRVNEPPQILEQHLLGSYVGTNMDTEMVLTCRASGKPKPYVLWAKDDMFLDNDGTYIMDFEGTLTIKSPSEEMSGSYVCVAKNTVGEANTTISVDIYSLPTQMQSDDSQRTAVAVEGASASVGCPLGAARNDHVKWYKAAKLISEGDLTIGNVSRADAGEYACVVSNAAGAAAAGVRLQVQWAPRLLDGRRALERLVGEDAYLDCAADATPPAKTKWSFNGAPMPFEDKDRLRILDVQPRHSGEYRCLATNAHGAASRTYQLSVLVPPTIVSSESYEEYVTLRQGSNATLECEATGSPEPNLQWSYKSYRKNAEETVSTQWLPETGPNITVDTPGVYRCSASSRAGDAALVYFVSAAAAPSVTDVLLYRRGEGATVHARTQLQLGESVRIACEASGEPEPKVQWIRHGVSLGENQDAVSYADLTLEDVRGSDAGVYTCVVANEVGSADRKIRIDVLEPPTIFKPLTLGTVTNDSIVLEVMSDASVVLPCRADGNPPPTIYWFYEGLPLRHYSVEVESRDEGALLHVRAVESRAGNYTCVARNALGEQRLSYELRVLVPPPTPKESTKAVRVPAGRALRLACPAHGRPAPRVSWLRHNAPLSAPRVTLQDDNYTAIIENTEVSDSGKYTCIMTNVAGATEASFDVTVSLAPSIAGDAESLVVSLMKSAVLKCAVEGHPPPTVTWLKDTQRVPLGAHVARVASHSLLALWEARARDAGQYACVAENAVGTAHRRYNVAVKVPGKWSSWSQWSLCDATCGLGRQSRTRVCQYIDDDDTIYNKTTRSDRVILDDSECKGPAVDKRKCHMPPCDEAPWRWGAWSSCSATCGAGSQARARRCRAPPCPGDHVQVRKCPNLPRCESSSEKREIEYFTGPEDHQRSEEITDKDQYMPEATYEMHPESVNSNGIPDVEEVYEKTETIPQDIYGVNVTSNLDFSDPGPCGAGYRHNATTDTCEDIDECLYSYNQCHATQLCVNTAGAYGCGCPRGYRALGAGQRCLDVNECTQHADACEFACVNVAGGYVCACPRRLRLHRDKRHCVEPSSYKQPLDFDQSESDGHLASFDVPRHMKYTRN